MFGSAVLEVGIGLTFFYLLLSVMCSAIQEWISGLLALRGENLRKGIANLLHDREIKGAGALLFSHPLIKSLAKPSRSYTIMGEKQRRPSYIPPKLFTSVLLDLLADQDHGRHIVGDDLKGLIESISEESWVTGDLKRTLTVFANEAANDLDKFRDRIEEWYSDCMDRVSGWYKRKAQAIIFGISLTLAFAINADTLTVVSTLWNDSALRTRITYLAETTVSPDEQKGQDQGEIESAAAPKEQQDPEGQESAPKNALKDTQTKIQESALGLKQFPLGWNSETLSEENPLGFPSDGGSWLTKIVGLMVTVFSVSLGAPFWFDLMGKLVEVRSSIQTDGKGKGDENR